MGGLFETGCEAQHFVGVLARRRFYGRQARSAGGQRAGLVEHHGVDAAERFERCATLDEDAMPRGPGNARDEGDGSRKDERAGRRGDEHRQGAHGIVGNHPRDGGQRERRRKQQQGIAVRHADERRLRGLGGRHHLDDARIGAVGRRGGGLHLESFPRVDGAASHRFARLAFHRDGLAGQGRFIERSLRGKESSIGRNDLARADEEPVPGSDRVDRHVVEMVADKPVSEARGAVQQVFQIALGASYREIFERVSARIHDGHDDRSEVRSKKDRGPHADEGHGVDAHPARSQIAGDGYAKREEDRQRAEKPE